MYIKSKDKRTITKCLPSEARFNLSSLRIQATKNSVGLNG